MGGLLYGNRTLLKITDSKVDIKRPELLNQKIDGSKADECDCKSLDKIAWMQDKLTKGYTSFWP